MIVLPGVLSNLLTFLFYVLVMAVVAALAFWYQMHRKPRCHYCGSDREIVRGLKATKTICLECFTHHVQSAFWEGEEAR